jgi:NADH-quinone oxidoreductase subunit C
MSNEEIKSRITELLPSAAFEESSEFLNVFIERTALLPLMKSLRSDPNTDFDYLFNLTCVDWKDHFMMVYHLFSKKLKHTLVIKAKIEDRENPEIESICSIWKTAELQEREVFDLFGVKFLNHPDLRKLFMEEDWKGFPLRKDYVDENMIEL